MTALAQNWAGAVAAKVSDPLIPYMLAIIENESGGTPGVEAYKATRLTAELPSSGGGTIAANRALGLMQTIPIVIDDYNKIHTDIATYEEMRGNSLADGYKQIDVGIWAFKNNVRILERILGQTLVSNNRLNENLLKLVLVAYAWGIGNLRNKLDVLRDLNLEPNFNNLKRTFPTLGQPANQPLVYVERIFRKARKYSNLAPVAAGAGLGMLALIGGLIFLVARGHI